MSKEKMPGHESKDMTEVQKRKVKKLEIFTNNKNIEKSLERAGRAYDLPPAALISLYFERNKEEWQGEEYGQINYEDLQKLIEEKVEVENLPTVIFSADTLTVLTKDPRFYKLLAYKKVGFLPLGAGLSEIKKMIAKLGEMPPIKDKFVAEISNMKKLESMKTNASKLRHKMRNDMSIKRIIFAEINKIYGTNFDSNNESDYDKAFQFLSNFKPEFGKEFEWRKLPGVFCDAEGTLIDLKTRKINSKILEKLDDYDREKFIRIWTGGDVEEIRELVAGQNRAWLVLSKYDFHGSEPEIVIDDLNLEEFEKQYGIKPKTFINTKEIDPESSR